jgi:hypothetical protein
MSPFTGKSLDAETIPDEIIIGFLKIAIVDMLVNNGLLETIDTLFASYNSFRNLRISLVVVLALLIWSRKFRLDHTLLVLNIFRTKKSTMG